MQPKSPLIGDPRGPDLMAEGTVTTLARFRSFMIRHRVTLQDLSVILATVVVATFLAFEFDIYANQDSVTVRERTIELDEALTLGGILCIGLLIFAVRRYQAQKQETRRRIAAEHHARKLAFQDPLTGLANRRQFDDALSAAIAAPPHAGGSHAVFLLDLNGFKQVNDVYGHSIGDEVLIIVAQRLATYVRDGDLVARVGGDEFAILSRHLIGAEAATSIAIRVLHSFEEPILAGRRSHQIGSGIGIALIPGDATTLREARRKADIALYRAKSERRSALRFFEEEMDRRVQERNKLDRDLRAAIDADMIHPFFQPVVDLKTNHVIGFEAIPLWIDASLGEIPLERFIPVAEENGTIHELVLDNFGTGYSSLYHLRNFKLDKIKLDRSFIETLGSRESAEIVSALVGLGHGLGLTIVAEGVEDSTQRASLLTTGCEQGQGFLFSGAVPAEETPSFFKNQTEDHAGSLLLT
jgi:diguanylate cyclase (GGDEF)-like protein